MAIARSLPAEAAVAPFEVEGNTHLWLLLHALALIADEGRVGRQVYQVFQSGVFHQAVCQGLWDADVKAPYNDAWLDRLPTWVSHFYDPDTGTNWMGGTTRTAQRVGSSYFTNAQCSYRAGNLWQAGYGLGLALHYLTDLTQPMHAANFTVLASQSFGYHTGFEQYAKSALSHLHAPRLYSPLLTTTDTPADFFHTVARYTKNQYFAPLCRSEWTRHYSGEAFQWEPHIGGLLSFILGDAVLITAQFLLLWGAEVVE